MGFFDDSIWGFDFNMDGKVDMMDDVLFISMMEESNKADDEKGFDPDYFDSDDFDIGEF